MVKLCDVDLCCVVSCLEIVSSVDEVAELVAFLVVILFLCVRFVCLSYSARLVCYL